MLVLDDLSLRLEATSILEHISCSLRPGKLTALVGRNGSGKSSLLGCVNQQFPYTGSITVNGLDLHALPHRQRAQQLAFLPQVLPSPHITVEEMVAFGRNPYLDFTGRLQKADREAVRHALEDARIAHLADRFVDTLSGGEKQRTALAMILAQDTPIALLDEPTAHLDQGYEADFLRLLTDLKQTRNKTFLVVLHDLTAAVQYADDLLVLDQGKLVFSGSKETCLSQQVLETVFRLHRYTITEDGKTHHFFASCE